MIAPAGTVTFIEIAVPPGRTVAVTLLLNLTDCTLVKFVPLIVTRVPTTPLTGENELIVAGGAVEPVPVTATDALPPFEVVKETVPLDGPATGVYRTTTPDYASDSFELELGPLLVSPGDDDPGPLLVPKGQLYATVLSLALLGGLLAFLRLTRTGRAIRATMQNRAAAQLVGVNVRWISTLTFGIGTALAGASGALQSFLFPFFPSKHWQWIAILLALTVLGGMGSLLGAFVGAMLLSIAAAVLSDRYGPTWSQVTFFLALFVVLLVRPHGLFGKKAEL